MQKTADLATADVPRHFPYVTRILLELYRRGALPEVVSVTVEPEYGYATRIRYRSGNVRTTFGNDIGLNPGAACDLAKDKAYAKFFFERDGIACPAGAAFLLPWWARRITDGPAFEHCTNMRLSTDAARFAEDELGFPVYVKPVNGSKGAGVYRCDSADHVLAALEDYAARRVKVALVEEAVELPDYRLVVLGGQLISAYRRVPFTVVGDGESTVLDLALELQARFTRSGRDTRVQLDDPRIDTCLARGGVRRDTVPAAGQQVRLHDISNLSTGGTAYEVTDVVAPRWTSLALAVAASFGLVFAGVDLACSAIGRDDAEYSVLEVNAAPGLDHYASVGELQEQIVRDLYARVLNLDPRMAP